MANTSINDSDTNGGNLWLQVYVNDTQIGSTLVLPGNTSAISTFDRSLGNLSVGDTVYVAIGPAGDHSSDAFGAFDFTIQFEGEPVPPAPEPSSLMLLGLGLVSLAKVRRRKTTQC